MARKIVFTCDACSLGVEPAALNTMQLSRSEINVNAKSYIVCSETCAVTIARRWVQETDALEQGGD
jgi:hypothetical protein